MKFYEYPLVNKFRAKTPKGFYDKVKGHTGVDFLTPEGVPLTLPFKALFLVMLVQTEMGNTAYLMDEQGNVHVFSHLRDVNKFRGDLVEVGEVFGFTGNTGSKKTGPHVHYEVIAPQPALNLEIMKRKLWKYEGWNVDPLPFLTEKKTVSLKKLATQLTAKRALTDKEFAQFQLSRKRKKS